jgi:hypothetical protein
MKVKIINHNCIITKESGDPVFSGVKNAAGESRLLHHIKNILNRQGYNLIKKRMWKDGHLMDDMQQYLRTKKPTGNPNKDIYIWNSMWAINGADFYLKRDGEVTLSVETNVFSKE